MKLSAPVHHLKRKARLLSRRDGIPLHAALDRVAAAEGFARWSLLAARVPSSAGELYASLSPGDLVLLGARPGQGKTLMSLRLAIEAMKGGGRCVFFTLEYAEKDVCERFRRLGADRAAFGDRFVFDPSDAISADYIVERLATAAAGTFCVVDYLQLLDQKRDKPDLMGQVRRLRAFAEARGLTFVVLSQIDRSYDCAEKPFPDRTDVRLPNPVDLALFTKAWFMNGGTVRTEAP
ncbi:DNA helicase [Rhizobium sp. TRM95111]|uniref:DNA helicase n=1 Tax=Rhizobium alarense TaxID=2846851 RepID=UPI001F3DF7BB|nr:DNA helicase [Rhizobium alarense]MCF3641948.1 DNA helicase [Rhizobium alarense]